jgi:hypothetical protein
MNTFAQHIGCIIFAMFMFAEFGNPNVLVGFIILNSIIGIIFSFVGR